MTKQRNRTAAAIILAALTAGCAQARAQKVPVRPVHVETVRAEGPAATLRYSATIQPYEQVGLAFKVGGYVRELRQVPGFDGTRRRLQQGDIVTRGTVLARIDPADYRERVHQAAAQLADAEAVLGKARADAGRAEALYRAKALTRVDYDSATTGLARADASLAAARAQLEAARLSLEDTALVAPADAVVLQRNVELGTLAGAGMVGFVLADLARVKAVFGVPDRVISRVSLGAPLRVTSDALGSTGFEGRVTAVSPSADAQSRVFGVEVTIPNPQRLLKAGMIATVEVSGPEEPAIPAGAATVSVSAVVKSTRPGAFAVFVLEGGDDSAVARSRDVTLGRIAGNRVAVESGLAIGDRVIVSGASLLTDGDAVRVIPGSEGE